MREMRNNAQICVLLLQINDLNVTNRVHLLDRIPSNHHWMQRTPTPTCIGQTINLCSHAAKFHYRTWSVVAVTARPTIFPFNHAIIPLKSLLKSFAVLIADAPHTILQNLDSAYLSWRKSSLLDPETRV